MPVHSEVRLRLPRPGFVLDVDLRLPAQGITVLFGASGSGKTTLLRCVAGLDRAPQGRVCMGNALWQDEARGLFVPTWRRALGMVFQEASLFDHLDVQGNLHFGLKRAGGSAAELAAAVELLGIGHLLRRWPAQLSGGERQRVAIARALATQPRLLLLDEPLASLDAARKLEILPWLERLRDELRLPMLYVTHSPDELARLADQVVVLEGGRVKQQGAAVDVLASVTQPVLQGDEVGALLEGRVAEVDARWHLCRVEFDGGSLWLRDQGLPVHRAVRLRVLARDVSLLTAPTQGSTIQNLLPCTLEAAVPDAHPSQMLLRARVGSSVLLARVTARALHALQLQAGSPAWLQIKSVAVLR